MLVLISNDDGVASRGLQALMQALGSLGRTVVVAPDRERSAVGHSLTLHKPLRVNTVSKDVYSVNGTPTDCITLAVNAILEERPNLLVSGINRGGNLGDNITYSGTVSAAMEGTLLGIPSLAVSLAGTGRFRHKMAASVTLYLAEKLIRHGLPEETLLNVNVPNLPAEEIRGIRVTQLGRRVFTDPVIKKRDPRGRSYYWIAGEEAVAEASGNTDYEAIEKKYISVTPIHLDLTHHQALPETKRIFQNGSNGWRPTDG